MPVVSCPRRARPASAPLPTLWGLLWLSLLAPYAAVCPAHASGRDRATSSRAARQECIQAMPLERLNQADLDKVQFVLEHTTIYRRMPIKQIDCDPHLFLFLVRHPEVVVNLWELLGMSNVSLRRTGEHTFAAGDGQGTVGFVRILHDEASCQLVYAEGTYEGPPLKGPVRGQCVFLLRTTFHRGNDGNYSVTARLDSFTHVDRASLELLAKTFQPLVGLAADYNFTETMAFVGNLAQATERNPHGVQRLCARLTNVDPDTRARLLELTQNVALRSARQRTARQPRPVQLAWRSRPLDTDQPPARDTAQGASDH